ncbi:hypothetical protein C2I17_07905 [Niallia circulans]|uniref:hypothetical protein n=1 Tax=Niallia circulans TaxID=1397 RepID=UPI00201D4E92|nr:hypothetical protein [Niallia circulans]UQZ74490.1 hypothetical protein C2I17_07905 [Niallia circulans]
MEYLLNSEEMKRCDLANIGCPRVKGRRRYLYSGLAGNSAIAKKDGWILLEDGIWDVIDYKVK